MARIEDVQKLRTETGLSIMDCKKALEEANGNIEEARKKLQEIGELKAEKKASREIKEGIVAAYIHNNGKIGVLVELGCETDFVAKNEEFKELANDLAMQIAAMGASSKEELLGQPFIKESEKTVDSLIKEKIHKLGENIQVGQFVKFSIY